MAEDLRLRCRACGEALEIEFIDLGPSPISNAFPPLHSKAGEIFYPLRAFACSNCQLVQLEEYGTRETHFNSDYAYFSSLSGMSVKSAADYTSMIIERLNLGAGSKVVEVASNDGYLLKNFVQRGLSCIGVDPAANCAASAKDNYGVDTRIGFFGAQIAREMQEEWRADLVIANNVLAHVPDINDFIAGFELLLKDEGVITFEFPDLVELVRRVQYDMIYHEHYSYLSLFSAEWLLARHNLRVFDVERLETHGGSLRLFACRQDARYADCPGLTNARTAEAEAGLGRPEFHTGFAEAVRRSKRELLTTLIGLKQAGASICGYGAAAKGATLLNYCGIGRDMLDFIADRNPYKQRRTMPGAGVPIYPPEVIAEARPDYVMILPWNIQDEIIASLDHVRDWGGKFILPFPQATILG